MRKYAYRKISVSDIKNNRNIEHLPSSTLSFYRKKYGVKVTKTHPNKEKIMEALIAKKKWGAIKSEFGCSSSTMCRYRKEINLSSSQNNSRTT